MRSDIFGLFRAMIFAFLIFAVTCLCMVEVGTHNTPKIEEPPAVEEQKTDTAPQIKAPEVKTLQHVPVEVIDKTPAEAEPVALKSPTPDTLEHHNPTYTDWELEITAIVIYQEAGGDDCSDDTRLKVGETFVNRVNSPLYPNTFEEVATERKQYGTLYWTGIQWPARASYPSEAHAVERAWEIAKRVLDGERTMPEDVVFQAEFIQGNELVAYQDGMYFCR